MRSSGRGWFLWAAVVFGLLNIGLPHVRLRAVERELDAGRAIAPVEAVRAYYTNDGDLRRYFSYAQATLGRPFQSYFVRSPEAWRRAFSAAEAYRPDEEPVVSPPHALMPYRDFMVEYPPGLFVLVLPTASVFHEAESFGLAFQCLMGLCLTVALVAAARATRVNDPSPPPSRAGWAALAVFLLGVVATHRFDASVALCLSVACWAAVEGWPVILGVAAGAAAALKGVPLIALPPLLMIAARERRFRDVALTTGAAAVTVAAVVLPVLATSGAALLETARYHLSRPIQIESTWAALLGLADVVRPGLVAVRKTYGSTNLDGLAVPVCGALSSVATIMGLVTVYVVTWRRIGKSPGVEGRRAAVEGAVASLAVFMVCGKVFSAQYLVWLLPMGLALSFADGKRAQLMLLLSVFAVTQLVYPIGYGSLEQLRPWALALVLGRNVLLCAWAWLLLHAAA